MATTQPPPLRRRNRNNPTPGRRFCRTEGPGGLYAARLLRLLPPTPVPFVPPIAACLRRPAWRTAFGVAALLLVIDLAFAVLPDPARQVLDRRERAARELVERIAPVVERSGPHSTTQLLWLAQRRDRQIRSIGLRAADGALLVSVGDHAAHWTPPDNPDDPPLLSRGRALTLDLPRGETPTVRLEMAYEPLPRVTGLASLLRLHMLGPIIALAVLAGGLHLLLAPLLRQLRPQASDPAPAAVPPAAV